MAALRGRPDDPGRQTRILDAAATLIARDGFLAVNMTDIGNAVGISGSGVYRHFPSKSAILLALFDKVVDNLVEDAEQASRTLSDPSMVLQCLVQRHIDFTLRERELCLVYLQEARNLPEPDLRRLRWKQRHYVDLWEEALTAVRGDLGPHEPKVVVHACIAAIHSVLQYQTSLGQAEQARRVELVVYDTLGLREPASLRVPDNDVPPQAGVVTRLQR